MEQHEPQIARTEGPADSEMALEDQDDSFRAEDNLTEQPDEPTGQTLNTDQELSGLGPALSQEQWIALPEMLGRLYFGHIESCSFHALKPIRAGSLLSCSLWHKHPMLVFEDGDVTYRDAPRPRSDAVPSEETSLAEESASAEEEVFRPDAVERRWRITGGAMMRPAPPGVLALGVSTIPAGPGRVEWTAWARVEHFPSVCVGICHGTPLRPVGWVIGSLYTVYHNYVSFGYLQKLAVRLQYGDVE